MVGYAPLTAMPKYLILKKTPSFNACNVQDTDIYVHQIVLDSIFYFLEIHFMINCQSICNSIC